MCDNNSPSIASLNIEVHNFIVEASNHTLQYSKKTEGNIFYGFIS